MPKLRGAQDLNTIDSANVERGAQHSGFEPESILIIIFCSLMDIEKKSDGLQVTHTDRSWN